MPEQIIEFDRNLFLTLNGCYNGFFDVLMPLLSNRFTGIPIYIAILLLIIFKWKGKGAQSVKTICLAIGAVIVTFALCDSLSVVLFKDTVQRLRPCCDPQIGDMVRMLERKGGQFGFVSSHAANLFGLAMVSSLILCRRWYTWIVFIYAAAVGYSRIYVGKHFPLDIVCGAAFGLIVGWLVYRVALFISKKYNLYLHNTR